MAAPGTTRFLWGLQNQKVLNKSCISMRLFCLKKYAASGMERAGDCVFFSIL